MPMVIWNDYIKIIKTMMDEDGDGARLNSSIMNYVMTHQISSRCLCKMLLGEILQLNHHQQLQQQAAAAAAPAKVGT